MLPPEDRLVGSQLHRYIKDQLYWVLHAPRQTEKTTFLQSWARETHLDALGERLRDPRIKSVIQTIITIRPTQSGKKDWNKFRNIVNV
ncbi:MAG: hypothetical protein LBF08_01135 [Dysgonamonadaceae bacterium]|jgi:hypothetical protein|nr:hypothetical protein [Dysgonamonadaceae bacterium]